jgi:transcriptional regulator with XRE-family HTH domain
MTKLAELRKERGWSQQDVAVKANLSLMGYNKIETGKTKYPRYETLETLARIYGITIDSLKNLMSQPVTNYDDDIKELVAKLKANPDKIAQLKKIL